MKARPFRVSEYSSAKNLPAMTANATTMPAFTRRIARVLKPSAIVTTPNTKSAQETASAGTALSGIRAKCRAETKNADKLHAVMPTLLSRDLIIRQTPNTNNTAASRMNP